MFSTNKKRTLVIKDSLLNMIPVVGVEPTLQRNTILSRARLPIPPHRHNGDKKNRKIRLRNKLWRRQPDLNR